MIRINLLPPNERKRVVRSGRIFKTIGIIVFSIYFCIILFKGYEFYQAKQDLAEMERELNDLQSVKTAMQTAVTMRDSIKAKSDVLQNLAGQRRPWQEMMNHFSILTSNKLWLREIGNDKDAIKVSGSAVDYDSIAVMLQQLERDGFFKEPQLIKAERDQKLNVLNYEIQVKLKGL